jgi:hypothetical protein
MTLPRPSTSSEQAPLIRSISGGVDRCASAAAALRLIGQATGHLPAKRRPSDADRRVAAAVVAALGEMIRERWDSQEEPWRVEIPESTADLVRRTGASENEVCAGLRLLMESDVVASVQAAGQRRLRLSQETFEEVPALARMDGGAVRRQLDSIGASVAPALAVIRELAVVSGGHTDTSQPGPWIEASLAHLSEATFFKRTAVSKALSDLESAGLIQRSARSGKLHSYRLLPTVSGAEAQPLPTRAPSSDPSRVPAHAAPRVPPPGLASDDTGVTVEVGGARIHVAAGVECRLEVDGQGLPVLRVGPPR